MYKSKLQEICQKSSWDLPVYTVSKEGLDHNPSFSATVVVNQLSFQSLSLFNSSKLAQNDAARLAFHHFSLPSPSPTLPSPSSFPQPSLAPQLLTPTADEQHQQHQSNGLQTQLRDDDDDDDDDVQRLYKNELQTYAQKRNLVFPVYCCSREGPPHAPRFKCNVTIDGNTFESSDTFPTLKEAELAAAKAAFTSLSSHSHSEQDDSAFYKNLLQQMFQKSSPHLRLPIYNTSMLGEPHSPLFLSTVEIQGQLFSGDKAKTKKLAEISAAKLAYISLRDQRKSSQTSLVSPRSPKEQEPPEFSPSSLTSNISTNIQQHVRPNVVPMISSPGVAPAQKAENVMGTDLASIDISNDSTVKKSPSAANREGTTESNSTSATNCFNDSAVDSSSLETLPNKINLSYKKITVYPASKQIPNGATLLPIRDDNWVAFYSPEEK